jgi:hypothetical protein
MKRTLFGIALIFLHFAAAGQAIIPFVGGNLSGYNIKQNNHSSVPVVGINVGAIADIRLSNLFSLQPGLQYSRLGGKINSGLYYIVNSPSSTKYLYGINAVQLPVLLVFKTGDEDGGRFFAGAGFYVTANVSGSADIESFGGYFGHLHSTYSLDFGSEQTYNVPRFDFGFNSGAGYHLANGWELYAFYQKGFVDYFTNSYLTGARTYQAGLSVRYALKPGSNKAKQKTGLK